MSVREIFDANSSLSWGRVGSGVTLAFIIGWINYAIFTEKSPLMVLKEIPWGDLALFVGTLYGIGKAGETVSAFGRKNVQP